MLIPQSSDRGASADSNGKQPAAVYGIRVFPDSVLCHSISMAHPMFADNFTCSAAPAMASRGNEPDLVEDPLSELVVDKVVESCLADKDTDSEWRTASDFDDSDSLLFDAKFLSWICENASDAPKTPLTPATFPSACKPPATAGREVASTRKSLPVALKIPENYPSALNSPGSISPGSVSPGPSSCFASPSPSVDSMTPLRDPDFAEQVQSNVPAKPMASADGKFPISVNGRCSHKESWSRLRGKRSHSYFVCRKCGLGWRQPTKVLPPPCIALGYSPCCHSIARPPSPPCPTFRCSWPSSMRSLCRRVPGKLSGQRSGPALWQGAIQSFPSLCTAGAVQQVFVIHLCAVSCAASACPHTAITQLSIWPKSGTFATKERARRTLLQRRLVVAPAKHCSPMERNQVMTKRPFRRRIRQSESAPPPPPASPK